VVQTPQGAYIPSWAAGKLLKGAGVGTDPTEIDVPTGSSGIYGDGSDGDITVNANPFNSGTLIVNNVLQRDAYFDNLTVENTRILETNGYIIFAKTSIINQGTIRNNGSNGAGVTGGAGGVAGSMGSGGEGGTCTTNGGGGGGGGGVVFVVARTINNTGGVIQANGGDGADAIGTAGAGGKDDGDAVSPSAEGGAGGDGGASGASPTGSGGATTTSYGVRSVLQELVAKSIGGGGGGGSGGTQNTIAAGGGGGGGGGAVIIIYNVATAWNTEQATAGGAGAGAGTGGAGDSGIAGNVIKISNA